MANCANSTLTPSPHVNAGTTRRALFGGATAVVIGSDIAIAIADLAPADPDAQLIATCSRFRAHRDALNSDSEIADSDPRWDSYFALRDQISDWQPETIDGLIAKARITKEEATHLDGIEELEARSMQWAFDVLNGLIRLGGRV